MLLVSVLGFACADGVFSTIRKATYPPSFDYITGAEIEGVMGQLAVRISRPGAGCLRVLPRAAAQGSPASTPCPGRGVGGGIIERGRRPGGTYGLA